MTQGIFKTAMLRQCLVVIVVLQMCTIIGCHRGYYRRQADAEARRLVAEKASDPRWDSADGSLEIVPESRMFNPFSSDHAPLPPDDPESHKLMHYVDGKEGYPHWHSNGDTDYVENPNWKSYLPVDENGQVVLTLDRAFQLASIHSPLLQAQRETLYLSALDVSLQRFGFDTQLFAGFNSFLTADGRLRNPAVGSQTLLSNTLGVNGGGINLNRMGITGATFAAGLANSLIFNLAGNNTQSATRSWIFPSSNRFCETLGVTGSWSRSPKPSARYWPTSVSSSAFGADFTCKLPQAEQQEPAPIFRGISSVSLPPLPPKPVDT